VGVSPLAKVLPWRAMMSVFMVKAVFSVYYTMLAAKSKKNGTFFSRAVE
jgi:hypothetical protein